MSEAKVILSAEDQTRAAFASAKAGLQGLHTSATSVTSAITGFAAAISAAALAAKVMGAIEAADHLNKLAQRTGIATEQLSQLNFAAKLSDVSTDDLAAGIKKLNVSIAEGLGGDKAKIEMFKNLGISLKDANGHAKTADKVMLEMAGSFSTAKDGAIKTAYAVGLMGKAGDQLIPLLNGGTRALAEMMAKADRLGLTISTEFAHKSEEFNDNLTILKASSAKLAISLGGDLVAGLGEVARKMAEAAEKGGKLQGIMAGLNELGNQMFDWERKQESKGVQWLRDELKNLKDSTDWLGRPNADIAKVAAKTKELEEALAKYYRLRDGAGAGRGTAPDPRALGPVDSIAKQTELKALTGAIAATASEYDALIKRINEKIGLEKAELAAGRELTEYEKFEAKVIADVDTATKALTLTQKLNIDAKLQDAKQTALDIQMRKQEMKEAGEIAKQVMQENAELAADDKARKDARDQLTLSINAETAALADAGAMLNAEGRLMGATDKERQIALEHLRIEIKLRKDLAEVRDNRSLNDEERAIAAQRLTDNAELEKQQAVQRASMDEFKTAWGSIDQTAHDVFTNIFEGGTNVFKKLGQTLKASLLDLLYQMTVKKWIFNIFANVTGGASGMAGMAVNGAVQGGMSSMLGGAGSSMVGGVGSSYLGGIGSTFMAGYSGLATTGASAGLAAEGATLVGSTGLIAAEGGGIMGGATAVLAAIPVWGWVALGIAAIAAYVGSGGGGPKSEAGYAPGGMNIGGVDIGGNMQGSVRGDVAGAQKISEGISGSYAALATQLGLVNKKLDVGIFYAMDNADGGTSMTQLQVTSASYNRGTRTGGIENVARGDQALKDELAAETVRVIYAGLLDSDLAPKFKDYLKQFDISGDSAALSGALTMVASVKDLFNIFDAMGPTMNGLAAMTVEATAALAAASGGFDQLKTNLASYYDNFYTEEEKRLNTERAISARLATGGLTYSASDVEAMTKVADPKTLFRGLVESLDLTTESGRNAYAALLAVNGAFASLIPVTATAADGVVTVVDQISEAMKRLNSDTANLQVSLMRAQGNTSGADAAQRTIDTAGLSQAELAVYDYNQSLRDQIDTLNAAATAAAEAATAAVAASEKAFQGIVDNYKAAVSGVADATQRMTAAESTLGTARADNLSALQAVQDYGNAIRGNIATTEAAINQLRGQASQAVATAVATNATAMQSLAQYAAQLNSSIASVSGSINTLRGQAAQAVATAVATNATAMQSLAQYAAQLKASVDSVGSSINALRLQAQAAEQTAQASLVSSVQALQAERDATAAALVQAQASIATAEQSLTGAITSVAGAVDASKTTLEAAQQHVIDLQGQADTALRQVADSISAFIQQLHGSDLGGNNIFGQTASNRGAFDRTINAAMSGDNAAAGQAIAAAQAYLASLKQSAPDLRSFQAEQARVEQALLKLAGTAPAATDPAAAAAKAFADATASVTSAQQAYDSMLARAAAAGVDLTLARSADAMDTALAAYTAAQTGLVQSQQVAAQAQTASAAASAAFTAALSQANSLGVQIPETASRLQGLVTAFDKSVADLTTARANAIAVEADKATADAGIVGQYAALTTQLDTLLGEQSALTTGAATLGVDLAGLSVSATNAQSVLDALAAAQGALATANTNAAALQADLYVADAGIVGQYAALTTQLDTLLGEQSALTTGAAALGVDLAGLSVSTTNAQSVLDALAAAQGALATANTNAAAVQADLYTAEAGLVDQYTALSDKLAGYQTALDDFAARTAGIDFSELLQLDPLGGLLAQLSTTETALSDAIVEAANAAIALASASATQTTADGAIAQVLAQRYLAGQTPQSYQDQLAAGKQYIGAAGDTTSAQIDALYQSILGRHAEGDQAAIVAGEINSGLMTLGQVSASMQGSVEALAKSYSLGVQQLFDSIVNTTLGTGITQATMGTLFVGSHADGLANVPFNNYPALLHVDEAVATASTNRDINAIDWKSFGRASADNGAMLTELRALRQQVASMQSRLEAGQVAIASSTGESARLARRWEGNGVPVRALDPTQPIEVRTVA